MTNDIEITEVNNDDILTVRIKTGDEKVLRVILAYGPQENEDIEEKKKCFDDLNP